MEHRRVKVCEVAETGISTEVVHDTLDMKKLFSFFRPPSLRIPSHGHLNHLNLPENNSQLRNWSPGLPISQLYFRLMRQVAATALSK